jgi:hypothetical protein
VELACVEHVVANIQALPENVRVAWKKIASAKHYGLLRHSFIDEEKHSY